MANIQERRNKSGELTGYSIRVYQGRDATGRQLKPFTTTFKVNPTWSKASAYKKALAFAAIFEKKCRDGVESCDRITLQEYCDYVLKLKENRGVKRSTLDRYTELTARIYDKLGHIKVKELRPQTLNNFYTYLSTGKLNQRTGGDLAPKTVLEYHRFISAVLTQALKEGIVASNVAQRAEPPRLKKKKVNFFQPEDIEKIKTAMQSEPLDKQVLLHLFMVTGARRGEIVGLKWDAVSFEDKTIHICNNVLYSPKTGVYETSPKTANSDRVIAVPQATIDLLMRYKESQTERIAYFQGYYIDQGYLFARDDGSVMHPDSVTGYFKKLSKKYDLPHINPHAFRHTMASILFFEGVDNISVSSRLGHAQPSTTADIYAHVIRDADKNNAKILGKFMN